MVHHYDFIIKGATSSSRAKTRKRIDENLVYQRLNTLLIIKPTKTILFQKTTEQCFVCASALFEAWSIVGGHLNLWILQRCGLKVRRCTAAEQNQHNVASLRMGVRNKNLHQILVSTSQSFSLNPSVQLHHSEICLFWLSLKGGSFGKQKRSFCFCFDGGSLDIPISQKSTHRTGKPGNKHHWNNHPKTKTRHDLLTLTSFQKHIPIHSHQNVLIYWKCMEKSREMSWHFFLCDPWKKVIWIWNNMSE